ncbi:MAG: PEP-CTERM sorting domain-containing protein [Boseongicola sp.]
MKIRRFAVAAFAAISLWAAAPVSAASIASVGTTDVTVADPVLAFLSGAGIAASPIAPATASGAAFSFPVTGGDTDSLLIAHSGGLQLSAGAAFLEATNFTIDGLGGTVSADVSSSAFASVLQIPIFGLAAVSLAGPITADLVINSNLNGALGATFAGDADLGLTGLVFGSASTSPVPVPLPAAMPLFLLGLAIFGVLGRRRKVI